MPWLRLPDISGFGIRVWGFGEFEFRINYHVPVVLVRFIGSRAGVSRIG